MERQKIPLKTTAARLVRAIQAFCWLRERMESEDDVRDAHLAFMRRERFERRQQLRQPKLHDVDRGRQPRPIRSSCGPLY